MFSSHYFKFKILGDHSKAGINIQIGINQKRNLDQNIMLVQETFVAFLKFDGTIQTSKNTKTSS